MAKTKKKTTASVEDKLKALHQLQVIDTQVDKIRIINWDDSEDYPSCCSRN